MFGDTTTLVQEAPVATRPYDFNAGDVRFHDRDKALHAAELRVWERGSRQQVRGSGSAILNSGDLLWLVQDV